MNKSFSECGKCIFYKPIDPKNKDEANAMVRGWMWGGMCNYIKNFKKRHHTNPLSESCDYGVLRNVP